MKSIKLRNLPKLVHTLTKGPIAIPFLLEHFNFTENVCVYVCVGNNDPYFVGWHITKVESNFTVDKPIGFKDGDKSLLLLSTNRIYYPQLVYAKVNIFRI